MKYIQKKYEKYCVTTTSCPGVQGGDFGFLIAIENSEKKYDSYFARCD